jgi:tRNA threonylcarbamoyladenosine modification (KEOPS) complex  Pcc1 subunit
MISLELKIRYRDARSADSVLRALEPDNADHVTSRIEGNELTFNITSNNAGTLRNAADDLLACVKIAEEALGLSDAVPDLDGDALSE